MKSLKVRNWLALLSTTILLGCSSVSGIGILNGVLSSAPYNLTKDVIYGTDARQKLDVYRSNSHNGVTIIFNYGGAWRSGEKAEFEFVAHALTRHGYSVVIPDYRVYPQVTFPGFVVDIANAIKHYEQSEHHIAGDIFVLMGHSAGAHTVALLTTDSQYLSNAGVETPISALIAMAGPYDLPLDDPEVIPVFTNIDNPVLVNPTLSIPNNMPPTLLVHGKDDKRVFIKHTYAFEKAIKESGNQVTVSAIKGGHTGSIASVALPLRFLNSGFKSIVMFLKTVTADKQQYG